MSILVVIGQNDLCTYKIGAGRPEILYVEGKEKFPIHSNAVGEDVQLYLKSLARTLKKESAEQMQLEVLEGGDEVRNKSVLEGLGNQVIKRYLFDESIKKVARKLLGNNRLLVSVHGINYEGYSYKLREEELERGVYDLLAYTIHGKDMIELLEL